MVEIFLRLYVTHNYISNC